MAIKLENKASKHKSWASDVAKAHQWPANHFVRDLEMRQRSLKVGESGTADFLLFL